MTRSTAIATWISISVKPALSDHSRVLKNFMGVVSADRRQCRKTGDPMTK